MNTPAADDRMQPGLHIFTSAAVNYLPKVRTLCNSIRRLHPEAIVHLALADERPAWLTTQGEPFDSILEIPEIDIPQWRGWTFMHTIVELATAIKPFALKHLLSQPGCRTVLYFDPDMVLFSRVDDIIDVLASSNVALTPHQTQPEQTTDAIIDNEVASLKMGVFNLGFLGVSNTAEGRRFSEWWAQRCYQFCRAEVHNGLFTDQKWVNFAPIFFDGVSIIKSSRHNVATWNLTTRRMVGNARDGFRVDGAPLGFYHFTGFDSGAHRIMAIKNASGNESVQELIGWYERETEPVAADPATRWPWAFGSFANGTRIEQAHRWIYRDNRDLQMAFPDPYEVPPGKMSYLEWCATEGRIRFPQLFGAQRQDAPPLPSRPRARFSFAMGIKLLLLAFLPRAGRSLRQRVVRLLKNEGLAGLTRRLRGGPLS
jgi:hypothetical protein